MQIHIEPELRERLSAVCEYLQMEPETLVRFALEQEIVRQEIHRIKDEITIHEIDRNILGQGQSLMLELAEDNEELGRHMSTCQMCLGRFEQVLTHVDGPLFCDDCLALARGGDFSGLEPGL